MENLELMLAAFSFVLVGLVAGMFLLIHFILDVRQNVEHTSWSRVWGLGWIAIATGFGFHYSDLDNTTWCSMVALSLITLAPGVLWIVAWFCWRKWQEDPRSQPCRAPVLPPTDDKDVWPPPPKSPA